MFSKKGFLKLFIKAFPHLSKKSPLLLAWEIELLSVTYFIVCHDHNPLCHDETWGPMCDASTWLAIGRMLVSRYVTMTAPSGTRIPP